MLPSIITASLLYNTYYPVSVSRSLSNKGGLIRYANCNWINNRCIRPIEKEYPDLLNYDHITVNELNVNTDTLFDMMVNNNLMVPMDFCVFKNKHHIVIDNLDGKMGYEIVATPLTHNRTRLFIFSNKLMRFSGSSTPPVPL